MRKIRTLFLSRNIMWCQVIITSIHHNSHEIGTAARLRASLHHRAIKLDFPISNDRNSVLILRIFQVAVFFFGQGTVISMCLHVACEGFDTIVS